MSERKRKSMSPMQKSSQEAVERYRRPAVGAEGPERCFPYELKVWLWLSAGIFGFIGYISGRLLRAHTVTFQSWEELFSMTPFTFRMFWLLFGAALGILIAGVAMLFLRTPGDSVLPYGKSQAEGQVREPDQAPHDIHAEHSHEQQPEIREGKTPEGGVSGPHEP